MFKLSAKVTIKSNKTWTFTKISSCEIERDIEKVTATCVLRLPKNTKWHNETGIPVKRGDKITVELGYDERLEIVFTGYIKSISVKTPIEINCEDEMFVLKNTPAKKKSYSNANLDVILKEQLPKGMKYKVFAKQNFGKYVVNSDTVSQLLGELSESGIFSFFKGEILYCGMIQEHEQQIIAKKQKFSEGENGNIIDSSSLNWNNAQDITLKIKASGTDKSGKKISVTVGDDEGEVRSFTTKEALKAETEKKLTEWKVSGLSGDFTTFGAKIVSLLDLIKVQTLETKSETYKVIKNVIKYGESGYRQTISIGGKAS